MAVVNGRFKMNFPGKHILALAGCLWLSGCAQQPAEPAMPKRIVDITPTITQDMPLRAVGAKFLKDFGYPEKLEWETRIEDGDIYMSDTFVTLFTHVGPHHDAPSHIIKGAKPTDQFPLDKFFGRAMIFDFRDQPKDEPLTRADFEGRRIEPGDIVIAFTGYQPPTGPEELPSYAYLGGDAAEYLASIPIKAFTSDMPSLGSIKGYYKLMEEGVKGSENFLPEHYAFLSREIPNIEGLVNLEALLGEENIVFVGFPLKLKDSDAGPIRAAALVY